MRKVFVADIKWIFLCAALAIISGPGPARADNKVYRKVVSSGLAFCTPEGRPIGAGVLVDKDNKLALTAYHVIDALVNKDLEVTAFFAKYENGRVVTSAFQYAKAVRADGLRGERALLIKGKVIRFDPVKDLALVQLQRLPRQV
jgi:S1-C subfamily serine protease